MEKGLFAQSIQWSTESYQNELQMIFVLLSKQIIVLRKSFSAQSHRRLLRKFPECRNFLRRFPRTVGWLPLDGCGTNWRKLFKRSETDSKLCIWLSYFGLQSVKDLGKFFSVKKQLRGHIVKNIETAGFEAAWEVTHICFAIFLCYLDLKDYRLYVFLSRKG